MGRQDWGWVCLLGAWAALPAQADIYRAVAADGTVTVTNVFRPGHGYERILRTPKAVNPPAPARKALPAAPVPASLPFATQIAAAAAEHGLPEALLHAVIRIESNYDPLAISSGGAIGLMQLMPDTAREMGVGDPWDPAANIRGGARYLKRMLALFDNDLPLALAAYNAGPGAVLGSGRSIPSNAETQRYVPSVMAHYERLKTAGR